MQCELTGSSIAQVLERCMMEALRLFPPLIMLLRQAKAPFAVTTSQGKTYVIPKVGALGGLRWLNFLNTAYSPAPAQGLQLYEARPRSKVLSFRSVRAGVLKNTASSEI